MTSKEKAEALVSKFETLIHYDFVSDSKFHSPIDEDRNRVVNKDAKRCAIAAIEEIIENSPHLSQTHKYWANVKREVKRLKNGA